MTILTVVVRRYKGISLLLLLCLFVVDLTTNIFQHNILTTFGIWFILVSLLYIWREFYLNGNEIIHADKLEKYPIYTNMSATFDKEGDAKVSRRLIFDRNL